MRKTELSARETFVNKIICSVDLLTLNLLATTRIATLKNFKGRTKVMEFFFIKVAGYNSTKKGLHQDSFMGNLLNFSKQFFY